MIERKVYEYFKHHGCSDCVMNKLPNYVNGLGDKKREEIIRNCPACRARWHKAEKEGKHIIYIDIYLNWWNFPCKKHFKLAKKRRFGSGITRRRWKKAHGQNGFSTHKEKY